MTGWEVLTRELSLPHERQLGGGGEAVFAPATAPNINQPGFRDAAYFRGAVVEPAFAVNVLDARGRALPTVASSRRWNPARLELKYSLPESLIIERRTVLSTDALLSQLSLTHADEAARDYWLILWTRRAIGGDRSLGDIEANPQGVSFLESQRDESGMEVSRWGCALGTNFDADSWTVDHSRVASPELDWESSPLVDLMTRSGLPGHFPSVEVKSGWLWLALAYPFRIAPGDRLKVSLVAALGADVEAARGILEQAVSLVDPIHTSEEDWISWFEEMPSLECSDPLLQRAYWHRMAARKIWRIARRPGDASGPSADGVIETSWRHDDESVLEGAWKLLDEPARCTESPVSIVLRRMASIHPDEEFFGCVASASDSLLAALELLGKGEENVAAGKNTVRSASSPGQVALALDLAMLLERIVPEHSASVDRRRIETTVLFLRKRLELEFWHPDRPWYIHWVDSPDGARPVKTILGLLPLLVDAVDDDVREEILAQLADPEHFWTLLPFPGVSRDESSFAPDEVSANGDAWRTGRVCPKLCSLAIESLGHGIERRGPRERLLLSQLIRSMARMGFVESDVEQPACFDHYHPLTGRGSTMLGPAPPKGWLADHLLRFVAGVRPDESGTILVDPLPIGLTWFKVERLAIGEREIDVEWDNRSGLTVKMDEKPVGFAPVGRAIAIQIPERERPYRGEAHPFAGGNVRARREAAD